MSLNVPHNDNMGASWVAREENAAYTAHIPLANLLIERHCKKWWKTSPSSDDYLYAQFAICCQLSYPTVKELVVRTVALFLYCSPVSLLNDPDVSMHFRN